MALAPEFQLNRRIHHHASFPDPSIVYLHGWPAVPRLGPALRPATSRSTATARPRRRPCFLPVRSARRRRVVPLRREVPAVPEMRKRGGGAIVSVGSMWAVDAIATTPTSAYSAAQAGRHAFAKNLAIELAKDNIRINTVALAFVETPAYERFMMPEQARAVLDSVNAFHPMGRHGQPEDIVEAVLFLASEKAGWITGTTLPVDGGVLAGRSPAAA